MAGTAGVRLGAAVVFVAARAVGRVLGAGDGGTEEPTVFAGFTAAGAAAGAVVGAAAGAEEMGHAVLPEEAAAFACPSFAS